MPKTVLVFGHKTFKLQIPDDATMTFGPFSPPPARSSGQIWSEDAKRGTLRIYQGPAKDKNCIAVFTNVNGYRDMSLPYMEQVVVEEGSAVWKDDQHGYVREQRGSKREDRISDPPQLTAGESKRRGRSK